MPIDRFSLLVVVRNQLSERPRLRRALALEAAMEELAAAVGADPTAWGMAGLGAEIDAQLCAGSPGRRGAVAEELLLTEGVPAELARAARERFQGPAEELSPVGAALVAAAALVERIYGSLEDGEPLDAIEARGVAFRLRRAAEKRGPLGGDGEARRALAALARLGLDEERAAEAALAGMRRVREDLRL